MSFITELPESWQKEWNTMGFNQPSVIQSKSFSPLRERKSVVGISPTGSGKTLSYVLPLLLTIEKGQAHQLLILAPSQELAIQINQVVSQWGIKLGMSSQLIIGGANSKRQIEKLKKKSEIIVGTPGRILELIKQKKIKSHKFETIVLDEVDQLIKEQELTITRQIIDSAPKEYQLVFFSATADKVIKEAKMMANQLCLIDATEEDTSSGEVTHYYMTFSPRKKSEYVRKLSYTPNFLGIIFFNQLGELGSVAEKLMYEGVAIADLASDQSKMLRKLAMTQFTQKKVKLLLTTEVAARGLDFEKIPFVVNAEVPLSEDSYIHRSGRVGRMGAEGSVITFVNDATKRDYQRLMKKIKIVPKELFVYDGQLQKQRKNDRGPVSRERKKEKVKRKDVKQ